MSRDHSPEFWVFLYVLSYLVSIVIIVAILTGGIS